MMAARCARCGHAEPRCFALAADEATVKAIAKVVEGLLRPLLDKGTITKEEYK
jgi:hypothetical protein